MDKKLTQDEINGLSPRARKAYQEKHGDEVISEILLENPNKFEIDEEEENEEDERKEGSNTTITKEPGIKPGRSRKRNYKQPMVLWSMLEGR